MRQEIVLYIVKNMKYIYSPIYITHVATFRQDKQDTAIPSDDL